MVSTWSLRRFTAGASEVVALRWAPQMDPGRPLGDHSLRRCDEPSKFSCLLGAQGLNLSGLKENVGYSMNINTSTYSNIF